MLWELNRKRNIKLNVIVTILDVTEVETNDRSPFHYQISYQGMFEKFFMYTGLTENRTKVGVIDELPLGNNQGFSYILRKS